ncbi:ribosome-associated translation inhibitor RaiA [bacterium]|nr:ribosome-associated translation inhibitor RaiA [bacterium]
MKLLITGRHIEITKAFNQYVRKRFKKWSTFLGANATVDVILSVEGYRHQVEVIVKDGPYAATGKQITKDMYQSVDLIAEKIGRQLMRQHEKLTDVKTSGTRYPLKRSSKKPVRKPEPGGEPVIEVDTVAGKPMTQEEAVMQLQAMRTTYLVFEDVETEQLAVLTKKKDGTFKLIVKE